MLTLEHFTLDLRSFSHSLLKSESSDSEIDVNLMTSTIYVQFQGKARQGMARQGKAMLYSLIKFTSKDKEEEPKKHIHTSRTIKINEMK